MTPRDWAAYVLLGVWWCAAWAAAPKGAGVPETLGPVIWVKVAEPMEGIIFSQIDDLAMVDRECKSDNTLPRVCLYRHLSKCRIITIQKPMDLPLKVRKEIMRMCNGYFPDPVLLKRRFSDPSYLPNQAPPSVDPVWQAQHLQAQVPKK